MAEKKDEKTISRIYQGRVTQARYKDNSESEINLSTQADNPLWSTYELFHHAVNYHLVALIAMGDEAENHKKLRERIESVWDAPSKDKTGAISFRKSLEKTLGQDELSFEKAKRAILRDPDSTALPNILEYVLKQIKGNIQQSGGDLSPLLCKAEEKKQSPLRLSAVLKDGKKYDLYQFVSKSSCTQEEVEEFVSNQDISSTGVLLCNDGQAFIEGDDLKKSVKEAIDFFKENNTFVEQNQASWEALIDRDEFYIKKLGKKTGGHFNKGLYYAYVLMQSFPSEGTRNLVLEKFGKKKPTEPKDGEGFSTDWFKEAWGNERYIYPYYLEKIKKYSDKEKAFCKKLEILALKEALTVINQFNQKTQERSEKKEKVDAKLRFMDEGGNPPSSGGDNDEDDFFTFSDDTRKVCLEKLLKELEQEGEEYGIGLAGLKGYGDVRKKLISVKDPSEDKLREKIVNYQSNNREKIGDINLYRALCKKEYWCIWQDFSSENPNHAPADKFLRAYADYLELREESEKLKEPIQMTAADPTYSPRKFALSECNWKWGKEEVFKGKLTGKLFNFNGEIVEVELNVSAPRFKRDGIISHDAKAKDSTGWVTPMLVGLGIEGGENLVKLGTDIPFDLMPRWERGDDAVAQRKMGYLINFPVTLNIAKLQKEIAKLAGNSMGDLQSQCNNKFDRKKVSAGFHLLWPSIKEEKKKEEQKIKSFWWDNEGFQSQGFHVLGVDLGQRVAAAYSLLKVNAQSAENTRLLGEAGGKNWYAHALKQGMVRLPGEGMSQWNKGKWVKEFNGGRGRTVGQSDIDEAKTLLKQLGYEGEHIQDRCKTILDLDSTLLYFMRRCMSRLRTFLRWSVRLEKEGGFDKVKEEMQDWTAREAEEKENSSQVVGSWDQSSVESLRADLHREIERLKERLKGAIVDLAQRVLPLKDNEWEWRKGNAIEKEEKSFVPYELAPKKREDKAPNHKVLIFNHGGLSIDRMDCIEELRRRAQSLNRLLNHEAGQKALSGRDSRGMNIPDACPFVLEKIDVMREQRVNQTAHGIIAQALGVRLKSSDDKKQDYMHGQYERMEGRIPVCFIVLEDLNRYRTSAGRTKKENSKLMQWCHRAILAKVKELAEPLGIVVLEAPAAYSSRFDSRTGFPGFRANEFNLAEIEHELSWRKQRTGEENARMVDFLQKCQKTFLQNKDKSVRVIVPWEGGKLFVPLINQGDIAKPINADTNAATNIALRGMASPEALDILHRVRIRWEDKNSNQGSFVASNKREKALWGEGENVTFECKCSEVPHDSLPSNAFACSCELVSCGALTISEKEIPHHLVTSKALWTEVKKRKWKVCESINTKRLDDDNIPM